MILAINSTTLQFGLALLKKNGNVLSEFLMSEKKGHFGSLMPALDFIFARTGAEIHDIQCLVVATGPGSFTGLRVGLSVAKGLSHALDVPLIGVSSLESLANQVPFSDHPIAPVLDSRRDELFTARFMWHEDRKLTRETEDISLRLDEFSRHFDKPTFFVGNDFAKQACLVKNALGTIALLAPDHCWNLRASSVGALGLHRFQAQDFDDPRDLSPIYLRPPDIRPNPYVQQQ